MTTQNTPTKSPAAAVFSAIAILAGVYAFLIAGLKGRSAGWEMLMPFAAIAVVCAIIAIVLRRRPLTYAAAFCGVLGVVGLVLGA